MEGAISGFKLLTDPGSFPTYGRQLVSSSRGYLSQDKTHPLAFASASAKAPDPPIFLIR
jgi:hypothetical protein